MTISTQIWTKLSHPTEKNLKKAEIAYLSKKLVTLKFLDNYKEAIVNSDGKLEELLKDLELKSIYKRLFGEQKKVTLSTGTVKDPFLVAYINDKLYAVNEKNYQQIENLTGIKLRYVFDLKNIIKNHKIDTDQLVDFEIISWLTDPDTGTIKFTDKDTLESFFEKILQKKSSYLTEWINTICGNYITK